MLNFLRFMEQLCLDVWCLMAVDFNNYTPGFIMDSLGHSDCVIKETLRIKVNAFLNQVFFVNSNRLNTVESKNNYLRYAVGGFLPGTLSIA